VRGHRWGQKAGALIPACAGLKCLIFTTSMLFLAAGFEMDLHVLRGAPIRNAIAGWFLSAVLALAVASLLTAAHVAAGLSLTALAMTTTAIGALTPMLRDGRLLGPPYGPLGYVHRTPG
jgi:Kef-type K+ transport system membrane component KefB